MIDTGNDGIIAILEQLLLERATKGFRPVLYISSPTDFQCSVLMLLPLKDAPTDGLPPPSRFLMAPG